MQRCPVFAFIDRIGKLATLGYAGVAAQQHGPASQRSGACATRRWLRRGGSVSRRRSGPKPLGGLDRLDSEGLIDPARTVGEPLAQVKREA